MSRPLALEELKPSIDTALEVLGWQPHVSLQEGLRATIAYFALQTATGDATEMRLATERRRAARTPLSLASGAL